MYETEEQKAAREQTQRLYLLQLLAGNALPGLIGHYKPDTFPPTEEGQMAADVLQQVPQLSAEQITEIGLAAYEIAAATLQAIEIGEAARLEQSAT